MPEFEVLFKSSKIYTNLLLPKTINRPNMTKSNTEEVPPIKGKHNTSAPLHKERFSKVFCVFSTKLSLNYTHENCTRNIL